MSFKLMKKNRQKQSADGMGGKNVVFISDLKALGVKMFQRYATQVKATDGIREF